jgi:hypothetical protein
MSSEAEIKTKVKSLVDRKGKTVTYTKRVQTFTVATGDVSETTTDYSLKVSPPDGVDLRLIDGDVVQEGDVSVVLPAKDLDFTPENGDKVTIDSVVWKVVYIDSLYTGELLGAYVLRLRS